MRWAPGKPSALTNHELSVTPGTDYLFRVTVSHAAPSLSAPGITLRGKPNFERRLLTKEKIACAFYFPA